MAERGTSGYVDGSPWKLGGLTTWQLARRTWKEMLADDVLGRSARLAYFFLFSIFPLVIFLTSLLGIVVGLNSPAMHRLIVEVTRAMPRQAAGLVRDGIRHSLARSGNGKLAFGILVALFSASSGMAAMIDTLNTVFDAPEERSMVKQRLTALWLTVAVGVLVLASVLMVTVGGRVAELVAGGGLRLVWDVVQYPVAFFLLLVAFSVVYRFAPNVKEPRWKVFSPGSVAGLGLWVMASFGLRVYMNHFNSYASDYGPMGAVMVLMLWFYLTGLAFLIGGEVDAIIEREKTGIKKHGRRGTAAEGRAGVRAA
jgi:membrane protein